MLRHLTRVPRSIAVLNQATGHLRCSVAITKRLCSNEAAGHSCATHSAQPAETGGFRQMLQGYERFRTTDWVLQRKRWEQLAEGQSPKVMVISCSDSRVDASQIFDMLPGEAFVVRNIAALVPPFETNPGYHGVSSALEFAVQVLKVREIVVMGHGRCGGIRASLTQELRNMPLGHGGFIADWIEMLAPARAKVVEKYGEDTGRDAQRALEQEGVKLSLANLRTFPCVQTLESRGKLKLIGACFSISDGILHILNEKTGEFSPATKGEKNA